MSSVSEVFPTDGNYPNTTTSNSRKTVTSRSECYVIVIPMLLSYIGIVTSSSGSEESWWKPSIKWSSEFKDRVHIFVNHLHARQITIITLLVLVFLSTTITSLVIDFVIIDSPFIWSLSEMAAYLISGMDDSCIRISGNHWMTKSSFLSSVVYFGCFSFCFHFASILLRFFYSICFQHQDHVDGDDKVEVVCLSSEVLSTWALSKKVLSTRLEQKRRS